LNLTLPDVCAGCGEFAKRRLYWEKPGEHYDSGAWYSSTVVGMRAPFCVQCLARHESEVTRTNAIKSVLLCFRSQAMIPAVLAGAAAVFAAAKLMPDPLSADRTDALLFVGVVGFFGLISLGSLWAAWRATRWRAVPPLTTVTGSFSFGGDESEMFEGERHRYAVVNEAFYEALLAANRDKVWKPGGARARRAGWTRKVMYAAFGVVVAVVALWEWIEPWVRVEW